MSAETERPTERPGFKKRVWGAVSFAGAGAVVVIWFLLTGGLGAKDFHGQDLRNAGDRFRAQDMTKSNFSEANVSGIDMTGIAWHESDLHGIIAEGTNLSQAVALRCDARNADFRNANLVEADFSNCDLRGADFRGADLRGVSFRSANLEGVDLRNAVAGPSCDRDRLFDQHPAHCQMDDNGCCPMSWGSAEVQGVEACTTPFWDIIRAAANDGFGVLGEPTYHEVVRYDNGRAVCDESVAAPPTGPAP